MPSEPNSEKSTPYKISLHKQVIEEDSQLFDEKAKEKIKKKCKELLSRHPEQVGEPLHRELKGYRKLKMFEDYRIIYRIDRQNHRVLILVVGIRRDEEVYGKALKRATR